MYVDWIVRERGYCWANNTIWKVIMTRVNFCVCARIQANESFLPIRNGMVKLYSFSNYNGMGSTENCWNDVILVDFLLLLFLESE